MRNKTPAVQDLLVHAWWVDTQLYSDHFFGTTSSVDFSSSEDEIAAVYFELQMIRDSFEAADYPPSAASARAHLLNSMASVMIGFQEFMAGNVDAAQDCLQLAQKELQNLETALGKLRLPLWYLPQRVH